MASSGKPSLIIPILVAVLVLAAAGVFFLWPQLESQPPQVTLTPTPTHLGRMTTLDLKVIDEGAGLASVRVYLLQHGKETSLLTRSLPPGTGSFGEKLTISAKDLGLGQGPAQLIIEARDRSLWSWFQGNHFRQDLAVTVDTQPPKVAVYSRIIHINRGGAGLVVYELSDDATEHGVTVGPDTFRGFKPWPDRPRLGLCFFAYGQHLDKGLPAQAFASDAAGNTAVARINMRLRWKRFRHSDITLSDRTLAAIAARFAAGAPSTVSGDLGVFLWVNEELRKVNGAEIVKAAAQTEEKRLWQEAFLRPRGKPMAGFGDRRTYIYQDKEVSKAVHLGVDLADVEQSPVVATAAGVVLHAGPLGIYGNAIILDHGQGVASLYGHLSTLGVSLGQRVERGQEVGRTGATGLALGDHLHYSILVGGVFVQPAEWWDPHWIQDNVDQRLKEAGISQ